MSVANKTKPFTYDLEEMFELRRKGHSYNTLGKRYGKDHTTIRYACIKFGIFPGKEVMELMALEKAENRWRTEFGRNAPRRNIQDKYADIFDQPVNPGKTYEEYVAEARKRPLEKKWFDTHKETNLSWNATEKIESEF